MKKLHLVSNAHLDPAWLWRWNEGLAEAISTFRVAADFCEEYDGYIFNHNEALLYEWVEEHRSSCCEMVTELIDNLPGCRISKTDANALMAGIILDTKNFTIRTSERTFDAAAFLRRMGADTSEVKKLLQSEVYNNRQRQLASLFAQKEYIRNIISYPQWLLHGQVRVLLPSDG